MTRRDLLRGLAALAASGYLPPGLAQSAGPPLAPGALAPLALALTGFAYADPDVATAMLRALNAAVGAPTLARIARLATAVAPAALGDALQQAGLAPAAAVVVGALYSGVVETAKGPVVITYFDALAWKAVPWTKPNAQCGGPTDYWSTPPAGQSS
jgi:hypothetical protein